MAEGAFRYLAVDPTGRRVRGVLSAADGASAFQLLRRDGYSPISLKPIAARGERGGADVQDLRARESAELLTSLADLLFAGADIRTSLSILAERFERPKVRLICKALSDDISGGESLERAFARRFRRGQAFVPSMVAAGEAAGDLPGGLRRAGQVIASRIKLRDQLVSVLAYPSFVLVSAIASVLLILLFIVPSIAPLAEDLGGEPPLALRLLNGASSFLLDNMLPLSIGLASGAFLLLVAGLLGALTRPVERIMLDGPARRTSSGLIYGAFAASLGAMLAAGTPINEALRLASRSVPSPAARARLAPVAVAVREGRALSDALAGVKGFPAAIVRLTAVGEASNTVGPLLLKGGALEEEAALKRIETFGRLAGPALIVILGLLLGVLMGSLLTGVSQMGELILE